MRLKVGTPAPGDLETRGIFKALPAQRLDHTWDALGLNLLLGVGLHMETVVSGRFDWATQVQRGFMFRDTSLPP